MSEIMSLPDVKFEVDEQRDLFKVKQKHAEKLAEQASISYKIWSVAWDIFSIIVFPVGLARGFVFCTKKIAPLIILPARYEYNLEMKQKQYAKASTVEQKQKLAEEINYILSLHEERERFIANSANCAEQVTVRSADGVELDALSIHHPAQREHPPSEQKWILYFPGNSMCYEQALVEMQRLAASTGSSVLIGNYRGVMRSKGEVTGSDEMVMDGEALMQYLLSKGIPPKRIFIHGHSLGGAVGVAVAGLHQEEKQESPFCSESSFSSLTDYLNATSHKVIAATLSAALISAGWKFDSLAAFEQLKGRKLIIYSKEDGVIKYQASLYKQLKEKHREALGDLSSNTYKPLAYNFVSNLSENGRPLSREEIVKEYGDMIHCYPIRKIPHLFDRYVQFVKESYR